ncbi:hypothetical protein F7984_03615 [Pradoshia sp. D12]|uniref:hypothetical protein n=1 Tax=unclassified Bacillus (in: firmicutes) TaxID=185979 RepID=UPI001111C50A|nr:MULTISPECIES: hypothetical protein [unclassified Bacillus (in: firmicutes)]QFK70393.1 hypothetical protein F7984_03615 [Pradoshia sp. D12]TPF72187.1 hypothetical protein FHY44_00010 [Bacillus sp. D12]
MQGILKDVTSHEAFTPKIETIIKEELARVFKDLLKKKYPSSSNEKADLHSIMISWSLYGMSTKYVKSGDRPSEEVMKETFVTLLNV